MSSTELQLQQQVQGALEDSPIGAGLADLRGNWLYGNAELRRLLLCDAGALPSLVSAFVAGRQALITEEVEALLAGAKASFEIEAEVRRTDGTTFWAAVSANLCRQADGAPVFLLVQVRRMDRLKAAELTIQTQESELARREKRLRLALDSAELGAWNHDLRTDSVLRTARHDRIFGFDGKIPDWTFSRVMALVVPEDRAAVKAAFDAARVTPGRSECGFRIHRANDGALRWVKVAIESEAGLDGAVIHLSGLISDVTQQREAEQMLRQSEERYRLAAGALGEAVWEWDVHGDKVIWTEALTERFGYAPLDLETSSQWWLDRIHPDDREAVSANLQRMIAGDDWNWSTEYRWARSDGSWADVIDRAVIVREGGRVVRMVGSMQDLTDRKRQEAELASQKAQMRTILETVPVGILMAELPSGRIVHGNSWIERNLRHPVLLSNDVDAYDEWVSFHADGRRVEGHEYPLARIIEAGDEAPEMEALYLRGDGSKGWIRIMGRPVRDVDGELIGGVVAIVDIDAERRAQEDLRQLNQQLEARVAEQVAARMRVEEVLRHSEKMKAIGQLTGGVAHDFNNLLTVMIGGLEEIVERLEPDDDLHPIAEMSLTAAERGAELTGQLLSFARQRTQQPVAVTPAELLGPLEPLIRRAILERVSLTIGEAESSWGFVADRAQLEAAVLNLCINARDAMPDGGELSISVGLVELDQDELPEMDGPFPMTYGCLTVRDTGVGMTPEVLHRATEPFFTLKAAGSGTGLGLSMVYGFVKQSGGTLRISSEVGKGTSVSLLLPLAGAGDLRAGSAVKTPEQRAGRILLVEDNEPVRQQTVRKVRLMGHSVVEAADAEQALRVLSAGEQFDLLFTDIVMPGPMDGRALAAEALKIQPDLRVLLATGYAGVEPSDQPLPGPVIAKPYKHVELAAAIAECMAGSKVA